MSLSNDTGGGGGDAIAGLFELLSDPDAAKKLAEKYAAAETLKAEAEELGRTNQAAAAALAASQQECDGKLSQLRIDRDTFQRNQADSKAAREKAALDLRGAAERLAEQVEVVKAREVECDQRDTEHADRLVVLEDRERRAADALERTAALRENMTRAMEGY